MNDNRPTITATEAKAIADGLGPWAVMPQDPANEREAVLFYVGPEPELDGAQLHLDVSGLKLECAGSMHVAVPGHPHLFLGQYLSTAERNAFPGTIGMSLAKPTAQLVRDIARRLIPGYLRSFASARRELAVRQAAQLSQQVLAEALARLIPGSICRHGHNVDDESLVTHCPNYVDLRVMSGRSVCTSRSFSMSAAQARLFAALLASPAWQQARGE